MTSAPVIDADQHLFEPRSMWRDHIDPAFRDDALAIEDDDRGYAWLTWRGRRLALAEIQEPESPDVIGANRLRMARGEAAEASYDDLLPASYTDPAARLAAMDEFGLDGSVLFPNFGLIWEEMLAGDLPAVCANMAAHNRWMAACVAAAPDRLFGVGHLSLRDPAWAVAEIARLAAGGVRLAMVAPAPVDGRPLSHPDLDPVWAAFVDHGVAPVFHVSSFPGPLDPAWHEGDPEPGDRLLDSVFLSVAPAVALANLVYHGTLERFPELRLGVVELTAGWLPTFLLHIDGAFDFYVARHGAPFCPLSLRPSEYIRRQVRVSALAYEGPAWLVKHTGEDAFMFGSDWPHAEGIAAPRADYERAVGSRLEGAARDKLFGGNVSWLLHQA
jgi:predicted TIM-barrel fold metal-dependent hydrolase